MSPVVGPGCTPTQQQPPMAEPLGTRGGCEDQSWRGKSTFSVPGDPSGLSPLFCSERQEEILFCRTIGVHRQRLPLTEPHQLSSSLNLIKTKPRLWKTGWEGRGVREGCGACWREGGQHRPPGQHGLRGGRCPGGWRRGRSSAERHAQHRGCGQWLAASAQAARGCWCSRAKERRVSLRVRMSHLSRRVLRAGTAWGARLQVPHVPCCPRT